MIEAEEINSPQEEAESAESHEVTFTQEQVNALLKKERSIAMRKAKQAQPTAQVQQQETTTDIGDHPMFRAMAEQIGQLTGLVQGTIEKSTKAEQAAKFAADTAGLTLSEAKKQSLIVLQAHPDLYAAELAELRAVDTPPPAKGPGFTGTGAPNAVPNAPDPSHPQSWSKDEIATMRANGTFLSNIKAYRSSMPGGSGGLFPLKSPKGSKS